MRQFALLLLSFLSMSVWAEGVVVFQSDFGVKDGAVAAMKGVAVGVSPDLVIHDLTHEIPTFNIWEAAIRLDQTAEYWPAGTVFVSVVDPGVGTERKSVVLETRSGHYFVTPDNGTLTFVAQNLGIEAVREIDEAVNRRKNSEMSYTFHGRDVYSFTGARLAAGVISFEEVGGLLPAEVVSIPYQQASFADGRVRGTIPILDVQFGNIWTNIDRETFRQLGLSHGDVARVVIREEGEVVYDDAIPYVATFGNVGLREPLIYLDSRNYTGIALNQGDFAGTFDIRSGAGWTIEISKSAK
jgi:S-adenosylmethionine hydrolase